jgi:hypothetical protein
LKGKKVRRLEGKKVEGQKLEKRKEERGKGQRAESIGKTDRSRRSGRGKEESG